MDILFGVIVGLFVLMLLVVIHEFGHFIMARRNGVKVNEFGIGFPPRAIAWVKKSGKWQRLPRAEWSKPQGSLIFSLNWLPIGGFCAMHGESDNDQSPQSFGRASLWQKTKILFGGVTMNWLFAFFILTILAWTGMPQFITNQFQIPNDTTTSPSHIFIHSVLENSPAARAGLQKNDQILRLDRHRVTTPQSITKFNQDHAGQTIAYTIKRQKHEQTVLVKLKKPGSDYLLGATLAQSGQTLTRATWSAPIVGAVTTAQLTGETFRGLGTLLWDLSTGLARQISTDGATRAAGRSDIGKVGDSVSGPIGIIGAIFPSFVSAGATNLAFLAAVISISLACMNILPIPALDGGRWLLIVFYRLRRKTLSKETEAKIVGRAFLVLIFLIILITILDITRFFK